MHLPGFTEEEEGSYFLFIKRFDDLYSLSVRTLLGKCVNPQRTEAFKSSLPNFRKSYLFYSLLSNAQELSPEDMVSFVFFYNLLPFYLFT